MRNNAYEVTCFVMVELPEALGARRRDGPVALGSLSGAH